MLNVDMTRQHYSQTGLGDEHDDRNSGREGEREGEGEREREGMRERERGYCAGSTNRPEAYDGCHTALLDPALLLLLQLQIF
jgi:hypothetical protein